MHMRKLSLDQSLMLAILFVLLLVFVFLMSGEAVYPKVYFSETVSVVGRFIEAFVSFFKKT
jgi:cell shape-determining protein MreC